MSLAIAVLSVAGLFLSLWIIVPAPTFFLLPLGVGAPEISPWLVGINAIALGLIILFPPQYLGIALASLLGLLLSVLPLIQLPAIANKMAAQMSTALGADYLSQIPPDLKKQMRPQPFVLLDVFRGIPTREVRSQRGITFASPEGIALKLNVYRPLALGKYPTVIVIYGGAWRQGTPDNDETFSRYLAAQGYTVIAIDYRHAPQFPFPRQLEDVQTALTYIVDHAQELEVDLERLALMGRSAGAHLAMLAAYQLNPVPVRAVVNYYGPANLPQAYTDPPFPDPIDTRAVLRDFLGGTPEECLDLYQQASPTSYIKPDLPPSLLVYAGRDHLVQAKFGRELYAQIQAQGNLAVWIEIPWAEHAFDAVFFGVSNQLVLYHTERFLAWTLRSNSPLTTVAAFSI